MDARKKILSAAATGDETAVKSVVKLLRAKRRNKADPAWKNAQEAVLQWRQDNAELMNEHDYALCQKLDEELARSYPDLAFRKRLNVVAAAVRTCRRETSRSASHRA
jgi:hypothetical protein